MAIQWSVLANQKSAIREVATRMVRSIRDTLEVRSRCRICLPGTRTAGQLYQLLRTSPYREAVDWTSVDLWLTDELHGNGGWEPPTAAIVRTQLMSALRPLPRLHPIPVDGASPELDASVYEETLRRHFTPGQTFDFALLGLGIDGRIAGLLPGCDALQEQRRWAAVVPSENGCTISLTPGCLNRVRELGLLVLGARKARILKRLRSCREDATRIPAMAIEGRPRLTWGVADRSACVHLGQSAQRTREAA